MFALLSFSFVLQDVKASGWSMNSTMYADLIAIDDTNVYIYGKSADNVNLVIEKRDADTGELVSSFGNNGIFTEAIDGSIRDVEYYNGYLYSLRDSGSNNFVVERRSLTTGASDLAIDFPAGFGGDGDMAIGNGKVYVTDYGAYADYYWSFGSADLDGTNIYTRTYDPSPGEYSYLEDVTVGSYGVHFTSFDCIDPAYPIYSAASNSVWSFDLQTILTYNLGEWNVSGSISNIEVDSSGVYILRDHNGSGSDGIMIEKWTPDAGSLDTNFAGDGTIRLSPCYDPIDLEIDNDNAYYLWDCYSNYSLRVLNKNDGSIMRDKFINANWVFDNIPLDIEVDNAGNVFALQTVSLQPQAIIQKLPLCEGPYPTTWSEPIVAGETPVMASHISEIMDGIDTRRKDAELDPYAWTFSPVSGSPIQAAHFNEMRTAIGEAYTNCSFSSPPWSETISVGDPIKAEHINELRNAAIQEYPDLLLHMDSDFADVKGRQNVWETGDAKIDITESKFGGGSGLFDGDGDYLVIFDSDLFDFSGGVWTIDFWTKINNDSEQTFFSQGNDAQNNIKISTNLRNVQLRIKEDTIAVLQISTMLNTLSLDVWHHIAVVQNGNDYYIFVDGILEATTSDADRAVNYTEYVYIGMDGAGGTPFYLNGWIDEFSLTKGVARWTSDFTPPTAPY